MKYAYLSLDHIQKKLKIYITSDKVNNQIFKENAQNQSAQLEKEVESVQVGINSLESKSIDEIKEMLKNKKISFENKQNNINNRTYKNILIQKLLLT
jgi:hypothetical protein